MVMEGMDWMWDWVNPAILQGKARDFLEMVLLIICMKIDSIDNYFHFKQ